MGHLPGLLAATLPSARMPSDAILEMKRALLRVLIGMRKRSQGLSLFPSGFSVSGCSLAEAGAGWIAGGKVLHDHSIRGVFGCSAGLKLARAQPKRSWCLTLPHQKRVQNYDEWQHGGWIWQPASTCFCFEPSSIYCETSTCTHTHTHTPRAAFSTCNFFAEEWGCLTWS